MKYRVPIFAAVLSLVAMSALAEGSNKPRNGSTINAGIGVGVGIGTGGNANAEASGGKLTYFGAASIAAAECTKTAVLGPIGGSVTYNECLVRETARAVEELCGDGVTVGCMHLARNHAPVARTLYAVGMAVPAGASYESSPAPIRAPSPTQPTTTRASASLATGSMPAQIRVELENGHLQTVRDDQAVANIIAAIERGQPMTYNGYLIVEIVN